MTNSSYTHVLFIDPLEKLSPKKDSSLQLALALKESGRAVYLLFEEDFFFGNHEAPTWRVFDFKGSFEKDSAYLKEFELSDQKSLKIGPHCVFHMRIDPPFDTRYLRYLWMQRALKEKWGLKILNDPEGIAIHNEKMVSYELDSALDTYVGSSVSGFKDYYKDLSSQDDFSGLILKPLDLFQGIGVEKLEASTSIEEAAEVFNKRRQEYGGAVVAQPFMKVVYEGELRSLYFDGKELGTIIKVPPEGEFLANIARGAKYHGVELEPEVRARCEKMSREFSQKGVPWLAFDILGGVIQEANLTCPGLLVEVSQGVGKNLAFELVELMDSYLEKRQG